MVVSIIYAVFIVFTILNATILPNKRRYILSGGNFAKLLDI
jgi:hypothetical protein